MPACAPRVVFLRIATVVLSLLLSLFIADGACLPDAITERQNITVDGVRMPLGILVLDWASAEISAAIFHIIVSDQLGFNRRPFFYCPC